MQTNFSLNTRAPLLSWDFFCMKYNALLRDAEQHQQTARAIKELARKNKWAKHQTMEALTNISGYVVVVTDHLQNITFAGKGFYEMTGYSAAEALGRNPKFLQGEATNKRNTGFVKEQLTQNEPTEIILENYRKNGELYLCKIVIKPVINLRNKLVNYIAYEQEIAA